MHDANHEHQPPYDVDRHLDEMHREGTKGDVWEMPALIALVIIDSWLFLSGNRGVALAVLWICAVAILSFAKSGLVAALVLIGTPILTLIGIIVMFQSI